MFRKPWTEGNATAYPAADTLDDIFEGRKRARKAETVLVPMDAAGHLPCSRCGERLDAPYTAGNDTPTVDEGTARVRHVPNRGIIYGTHYYCSWMTTMQAVVELSRAFNRQQVA